MEVSLEQALHLVQKAVRAGSDQKVSIVAVVTDPSGNIVAAARMAGVSFINTEVARKKALAAAAFASPTHDLIEMISRDQFARPVVMSDPNINILPGGIPLYDTDKRVIGALGIAGGYYLQDRAIAEIALSE